MPTIGIVRLVPMAIMPALFAACSSSKDPQPAPAPADKGKPVVATVAAKGPEPAPFALTATEDAAHRKTVRIVAATGGVIETVDAQSTRYRLTIPKNALLVDTDVVLTPLPTIAGLAGQTRHIGVDLGPAGTRLYDLATLEIEPTTPLGKGAFWFETEGTATAPRARLGFPAVGKGGVMLSHFSGGSVAEGGPATRDAMGPLPTDGAGSRGALEGARNLAIHDFTSGRIDKAAYDRVMEIIDTRLQESIAEDLATQLKVVEAAGEERLAGVDDRAAQGNLDDLQVISDAVGAALLADRQNALLGRETDVGRKALTLFAKYYAALLANCSKRPLPASLVLGMERTFVLLGATPDGGDTPGFRECLKLPMTASGGGNGLVVRGTVTDVDKPFALDGEFPGGGVVKTQYTPDPKDSSRGTVTYTFSGSGVSGSGSGTYTTSKTGGVITIEQTTTGCVTGIPSSCRERKATIKLE